MSLLAAQCVIVWLCLQLPLGMIIGRYIASTDVIAKQPLPLQFKVSRCSGEDEVMPEGNALKLNRAARDVIAERQR